MNTILTLRKRILRTFSVCSLSLALLVPQLVGAQEALTLSISPSLFDMSVSPNQEWRSSLRVINVNDYDLTVYVDVVNFLPQGEAGNGRFVPIDTTSGESGATLAEWFILDREPIIIPREQSKEIPIAVRVPADAAPGGHFAAILVGTKPPSTEAGQARVQTSQMVTSLFFARVAGDIRELGMVREFTTTDRLLATPEATFELRFENKGNVHLQPQGEIKITNMWGEERGIIPINQSTQFGNVLPESIRKFTFSWKGEWSFSDIGRYQAELALAYGTEGRQFATAATYFWVIPFKLVLGIVSVLVVFGLALTWLVRLYVRRVLILAGIDLHEYREASHGAIPKVPRGISARTLHTPMTLGLADFRAKVLGASSIRTRVQALFSFVIQYRLFFVGVFLILIFMALLVWFVRDATTDQRGYEIEYVNADANLRLTSEEIIYKQLRQEREVQIPTPDETLPPIKIVNRSGAPGLGAEAKLRLEERGYTIIALEADFATRGSRTVIVYSKDQEREALRLSARLNNAPVSTYETDRTDGVITVYVGDDIRSKE